MRALDAVDLMNGSNADPFEPERFEQARHGPRVALDGERQLVAHRRGIRPVAIGGGR